MKGPSLEVRRFSVCAVRAATPSRAKMWGRQGDQMLTTGRLQAQFADPGYPDRGSRATERPLPVWRSRLRLNQRPQYTVAGDGCGKDAVWPMSPALNRVARRWDHHTKRAT